MLEIDEKISIRYARAFLDINPNLILGVIIKNNHIYLSNNRNILVLVLVIPGTELDKTVINGLSTIKTINKKYLINGYALLILAALAIVISFGGSTASEALRYQRDAILAGQFWRILTAPLVHLNWSHTLMNVGGLIIIWGLFGQVIANRAWVFITLGCALAISSGLLLLNPEVSWYVGLSGILHGCFTAGAIAEWRTHKQTCIVMLLLVCSKLLWEQMFGSLPGSAETAGGKVIVDAHLYGAITGLALGWFLSRNRDNRSETKA